MNWITRLRAFFGGSAPSLPLTAVSASSDIYDKRVEDAIRRSRSRWESAISRRADELDCSGDSLRATIVRAMAGFAGMNPEGITRALKKTTGIPAETLMLVVLQESASTQIQAKLGNYREQGITQYRIRSANDENVCEHCRKQEEAGPYHIDSGIVPGYPHCKKCRCTIQALG